MRLLLDARAAASRRSGVGNVAHHLLTAIVEEAHERGWSVELFGELSGLSNRVPIHMPKRLPFAQHHELPIIAARTHTDHIFVPRQTGPMLTTCKWSCLIHDIGSVTHSALYKRSSGDITTRMAMRRASNLFAITNFTAAEVESYGTRRAVSLDLGAQEVFEWAPQSARGYILTVAAQEPHKNLPLLIEAWLASDLPNELVLVGRQGKDSDRIAHLQAEARSKGRALTLLSNLSYTDLASYFRHAWAYIQPSFYEGLCLPLVDSLASGIPTVSSMQGNGGHVLRQEPELLFDAFSLSSIRAALIRIVQDHDFRKRSSAIGPIVSSLSDWPRAARIVLDKIDSGMRK